MSVVVLGDVFGNDFRGFRGGCRQEMSLDVLGGVLGSVLTELCLVPCPRRLSAGCVWDISLGCLGRLELLRMLGVLASGDWGNCV